MKSALATIVGMHYRPPAKALIAAIPVNTKLRLEPEPDNPHDPNAVAVWLDTVEIPDSAMIALDEAKNGLWCYDMTIHDLAARDAWQLGYISREEAEVLRSLSYEPIGTFQISANNAPKIKITIFD